MSESVFAVGSSTCLTYSLRWQAPPSISQALGTTLLDNLPEGSGSGGIHTSTQS